MKFLTTLALGAVISTEVLGAAIPRPQEPLSNAPAPQAQEKYLVELGPDRTRWVTEEEKWALKLDGVRFIDVTEDFHTRSSQSSPAVFATTKSVSYPPKMQHVEDVLPLTKHLSKDSMRERLEAFTSFHTRYYKSATGVQSATWLYNQIAGVIQESGAEANGVTVEKFAHPWGQFSIIARIPGQSNKTVVLGAHQDSINLYLPSILAAPGADDDGSGTVTILEAFSALLKSDGIAQGKAPNTLEFHWYSAEEGGLLGSQAIFSQYRQNQRDVKAMLQQDMTGYSQGMLDAGLPESVGVIVDYVDQALTRFIKGVISTYCDIPYVETKCGYACSDHASASKNGYPSAFVIESEFEKSNKKIHTSDDLIKYLSFDHMLQHAKMSLAFAYELAFASF